MFRFFIFLKGYRQSVIRMLYLILILLSMAVLSILILIAIRKYINRTQRNAVRILSFYLGSCNTTHRDFCLSATPINKPPPYIPYGGSSYEPPPYSPRSNLASVSPDFQSARNQTNEIDMQTVVS